MNKLIPILAIVTASIVVIAAVMLMQQPNADKGPQLSENNQSPSTPAQPTPPSTPLSPPAQPSPPSTLAQPISHVLLSPGQNVYLIFDSSISMSDLIGGERKIDIAKSVLSTYVTTMHGVDFALRAYGHRSSSCNDTELLFPFGETRPQELAAAVNKMEPLGLTPIEYSLRQAIADLPSDGVTTVILVSDGEETCGGDPCKAVRELRAAGADFVLHTVGFGINEAGRLQLQCMADAGGGTYRDANNADELLSSLSMITEDLYLNASVVIDGLRFSVDKIHLNLTAGGRSEDFVDVFIKVTNLMPQKSGCTSYLTHYSILNDLNESIDFGRSEDSSSGIVSPCFIVGSSIDKEELLLSAKILDEGFEPGEYALRTDIYRDVHGTDGPLLGTLNVKMNLSERLLLNANTLKEVYNVVPADSAVVGGIQFSIASTTFTEKNYVNGNAKYYRADINISQTNMGPVKTEPYTYTLQYLLLNEKNEIVDTSTKLYRSEAKSYGGLAGTEVSENTVTFAYTHEPGEYTLVGMIYPEGSNIPVAYITKSVML